MLLVGGKGSLRLLMTPGEVGYIRPVKKKNDVVSEIKSVGMDAGNRKTECDICLYSDVCPSAFDHAKCPIVDDSDVKIEDTESILALQKSILKDAVITLKRAERLARLGAVPFDDVDRVRRQVLEFSEKLKKSIGVATVEQSAAEKLGIRNGTES